MPFSFVFKGSSLKFYNRSYSIYNEFMSIFYFIFFYNKILKREKITIVHLNSLVLWPLLLVLPKSMKKIIHIREVLNDSLEAHIALLVIKRYATKIISIDPISDEAFSKYGKSVVILNPFNMKRARQLREKKDEIKLKYKIQADTFVISLIGRIEEAKGQDLLPSIAKKLIDKNVIFLIVGLPSGNYGKSCLDEFSKYSNIKYLGQINDMDPIYAITDILLRTDTIKYFPLGRTVWETIFSGGLAVLPVKREYNLAHLKDIISKYIFTYSYRDEDSATEIITSILQNNPNSLINSGFQTSDNSEQSATEFYNILQEICNHPDKEREAQIN